ncbi:hypothetical protein ACFQO8_10365 [Exiguobacterium aestuarii]|uniref:Carboxypeptidase regulatory-like domain-containing protein n=1 Tax=Exiguobacterium aestuarii TaxID=273527 RepID=A0ABW2PM53_9BACL|nr:MULTISPECIES: hypothetical protein [Exiguobacterium]MCT4785073.1 hypothetical protein [Exiguobacterium aestuarii]
MSYTRSRKKERHSKAVLALSVSTILVGAIVFYIYGYKPAAEQDKIHVAFKEALLEEDRTFFEEKVEYQGEALTRAEALRFMGWLNDEKSIRGDAIAEVAQDRANRTKGMEAEGLFRLIDTGEGRFGFSDYRIELLPQQIDVTSDVPMTNIWVDGQRVGRIDEANGRFTFERMPGSYDVKAVAVANGETVSETETIQLITSESIDYALMPESSEAIAGQFDLKRAELIEIEVEAQTGHPLETIDSLIGQSKRKVQETLGEPDGKRDGKWDYERLTIVFEEGDVQSVMVDLDKRPDDLIALLGEPKEKTEHQLGTEWDYGQSFFESFFTFFGLETEKQFIEKNSAMYLLIQ